MSYINVYPSRINWENEPNISTPINATNLNKADYALYAIDQTLAGWDTSKADESDLLLCVKTIDYDTSTGVFVFTWQNGTTKTVDLNIEKIPVSFSMDANGVITMTTEDGTTYTADVGALIKTYTFTDSTVIDFTVTTDASGNKTVTADIVDGSITGQKLQPNYLADCQTAATNSSNSASAAASSKGDSEAWAVGTRGGIPVPSTDPAYNNNSYYWSQHGASNSLAGLTDTDITNPTSGQTIIYDTTDAKWKNGSAVGGGSTIVVTTTETTLYGQNVTITDGTTTLTETFDNTGVATFKGVTMTGNVTIASGTTSTSLNIPYFGNYTAVLSSFSASITVTYPNTASCTCTGNGESYTASGSPYTFTVHGVATYTITTTLDGVTKTDTVIITTDGQTESVTVEYGTINLTYADDFRGQTVNCVNGGTTITKTAPSSGNTMVFYPPTTGTWVISSTVSGSTYTVNAVIASLSTPVSATLNAIPDGGTVTPTDDIQIWLACAGITDKSYTTLSEVLADTDTYTTLLGDSNACDYMARSTTWALATGQVPVMTDNTHPSGVAFSTNYYSDQLPWKAFNGNTADQCSAQNNSLPWYIGYQSDSAINVRRLKVAHRIDGKHNTAFVLQGSNNGSSYTDLGSYTNSGQFVQILDVNNSDSYTYHRIKVTSIDGSGAGFSEIQFYGENDVDITTNETAMRLLGMYDYACDALLSDSTWASAIRSSSYMDYVIDVTVPTMTSNTTPSGVVSATTTSTNPSQREPYRTFSNNTSNDGWLSLPNITISNQYLQYEFPNEVTIYLSEITNNSNEVTYDYGVNNYDIEAYDNATQSWVVIASGTVEKDTINTSQAFSTVIKKSNKYRIHCLDNHGNAGVVGINKAQFYGRHTAQADIIRSAPSDTIYYMDNGSPVTLCTTDASGVGTVDWSDLPTGDIILYSSVAKNPTDLTADYSKSIKVTKNKVEGYLMPDKVLYWWGWESDEIEDGTTANGWSAGSGYSWSTPTHNTNDIVISTSNTSSSLIGTKTKKTVTKYHGIYTGMSDNSSGSYGWFASPSTKVSGTTVQPLFASSSMAYESRTYSGNVYLVMGTATGRKGKIHAFWYE